MATRKASTKTATIDSVKVCSLALKQIKSAGDYHRIGNSNPPETLTAAWEHLTESEQQHIIYIVNSDKPAEPQAIADELAACGSLIQLQAIKSSYGDIAVKTAWRLLPQPERDRLTAICKNEPKDEVQPMTELTAPLQVEPQPKRTLFSISEDLEKLNELLDEIGNDTEQQEIINNWLDSVGEERDRKLDGYAALISEMQARADVRKAEARRMQELATTDENRARLLKARLKTFFETHDIKTIETPRYKLTLAKNGGKAPLILDENLAVTQLPEHFQRVTIDADTVAIREALEKGESLDFARLGERGTSLRIK